MKQTMDRYKSHDLDILFLKNLDKTNHYGLLVQERGMYIMHDVAI